MNEYEKLKENIKTQKEEEFKALKTEINGLEAFFEKYLKIFFESSSSKAERDFNVSSL
ncbi:hypothetical protein IAC76_04390 [Spirochaetes bacterium]|uniref:Uncharacterized protein n=1 Tax=Candidatus Scatousia excrementipullorum TaxID=2840936 RepID=A0A9D9DSQ4_9BACT|nr:hypothetical protein [Candidatus Scatousia excrementipullorum]